MHNYTSLNVHITFATADRRRLISQEMRPRLHAYLGGIASNLKCAPLAVNGVEDHVHLLIGLAPTVSVAELINKLKSNSSRWVHDELAVPMFGWQRGYGAFTVSPSAVAYVHKYISNQEAHHRAVTFEEEFEKLLMDAGIEFDRRYLFV